MANESPLDLPAIDGWYTITPKTALELLRHNTVNRLRSNHTIKRYARIMSAHRWKESGQPIIRARYGVGPDGVYVAAGTILNGQHQLAACFESKTSFRTYVVNNVDPAAYSVMDTGKRRSPGDVIGIDGKPYARDRATVGMLLICYGRRQVETAVINWPDVAEVRDFLDHHPDVGEAIRHCQPGRYLLPISVISAAYCICRDFDREIADRFFDKLISGEGLVRGSGVFELRRMMERRGKSKFRPSRIEMLALILKAFIAYHDGRAIKVLVWRRVEEFPYLENMDDAAK